jgi:hypothetical protein
MVGGALDGHVQDLRPLFPFAPDIATTVLEFVDPSDPCGNLYYAQGEETEKDSAGRIIFRPATIVMREAT